MSTVRAMTLTEFLLARIAEDEATDAGLPHRESCRQFGGWPGDPESARECNCGTAARVLAECAAKRKIVAFHESWPVLVEKPTEIEPSFGAELSFVDQMTFRASRQIAWMTQQEYRNRFGDEPPTGPMLAAMAEVYADHSDYRDEWAVTTNSPK